MMKLAGDGYEIDEFCGKNNLKNYKLKKVILSF